VLQAVSGRQWDLLGLGAVSVDDVYYVNHYPPSNTKIEIQGVSRRGGGLAGTALVTAARLGARAAYCGVLGDDELSTFTLKELESEGVDCTHVERRPDGRPFHALVIVDSSNGERTILYTGKGVSEPSPDSITEELIGSCQVLFIDHTVVASSFRALEIARRVGATVVADLESRSDPRIEALQASVDHLIVGVDFARAITGSADPDEMVRRLSRTNRIVSVVTAGDRGCWWARSDGESHWHAAFDVDVVDTIGCGDVFHGAYAARIAVNDTIENAVHVAAAAAALKAASAGRAGTLSWTAVEAFLRSPPAMRKRESGSQSAARARPPL